MPVAAIEIRDAANADALHAAWPVVQQLRPEFDCEGYVAQVLRQIATDGCRASVLYDDGIPRAFACWRVMEMLAVGKHVYVDDLVTDASVRSRGYGKAMLDWLKAEAKRLGCEHGSLATWARTKVEPALTHTNLRGSSECESRELRALVLHTYAAL